MNRDFVWRVGVQGVLLIAACFILGDVPFWAWLTASAMLQVAGAVGWPAWRKT